MADINITPEGILEKLKEKGAKLSCPTCGGKDIGIAPGFTSIMLQNKIDGSVNVNGPHVPAIYTVCNKCGAMTPHAVAVLEILNQK
ncbi:hypothetical protein LW135_04475 [Helicobacter sp. faydin-H20]|uniref:hypothetical protein n=1 Tax=Helicobacter anatolicus TaxID=2905874 RepID=UPI001E53C1F1|nr:hypothetical protein [Helicobacter anatolicus]MCE3037080.1 hypothetical protein [Helicobacter anatolicus]